MTIITDYRSQFCHIHIPKTLTTGKSIMSKSGLQTWRISLQLNTLPLPPEEKPHSLPKSLQGSVVYDQTGTSKPEPDIINGISGCLMFYVLVALRCFSCPCDVSTRGCTQYQTSNLEPYSKSLSLRALINVLSDARMLPSLMWLLHEEHIMDVLRLLGHMIWVRLSIYILPTHTNLRCLGVSDVASVVQLPGHLNL